MIFKTTIKSIELNFETDKVLFSPGNVDLGTLAMLDKVEFQQNQKILDLGCGYGVVGIIAAHFTSPNLVYMTDSDPRAVEYAKKNIILNNVNGINIVKSDAFENFTEVGLDMILSNPPYHSDFSVPRAFIEKGFNRLKVGGTMFMVTKRLLWYKNKFTSIFGNVSVYNVNDYFVFKAIKKQKGYDAK